MKIESIITKFVDLFIDGIRGLFKFIADIISKNLWIIIIIFAVNYAFDHKINKDVLNKVLDKESTRLKVEEGEEANAVIYMDDRIIVIQKKGEKPKQYVGVKKAKLTKFEDGEVKVDVTNKGLGIEPGFVMAVGDGLRLGVDAEFMYWRRWGLLLGTTYPVNGRSLDRVRGHAALSYDLPNRWFSSTSLFAGIDTNKTPVMGLRTRFGGGI